MCLKNCPVAEGQAAATNALQDLIANILEETPAMEFNMLILRG